MGSVGLQFCEVDFSPILQISKPRFSPNIKIRCGLRNGQRKPMWRSRVLSTEAIQAVQSLKLAKSPPKLDEVFNTRISRLLKADLLDTLTELQRQNELDLAIKVFAYTRKEVWYEPNLPLFGDMIRLLGKNKLIDMVEELFSEIKREGLEPDTRAYTELIGAYLQVGMVERAIETYKLMKTSGCVPDKLTMRILIRNLESAGEEELAATIKKECAQYLDSPKKFLREVERTYIFWWFEPSLLAPKDLIDTGCEDLFWDAFECYLEIEIQCQTLKVLILGILAWLDPSIK